MAKNCTACNTKHLPPFGSRCKKMAGVILGYQRTDAEYVKLLEESYVKLQQLEAGKPVKPEAGIDDPSQGMKMDKVLHTLDDITKRLSNLETNQAHPPKEWSQSAAELMAAPLTKALSHLTSTEDDDIGRHLRPETYSQSQLKSKQRDFSKMDSIDLFYGWICVADYLDKRGGDLSSYLSHVKFATQMLHSRQFYDVGAIHYD